MEGQVQLIDKDGEKPQRILDLARVCDKWSDLSDVTKTYCYEPVSHINESGSGLACFSHASTITQQQLVTIDSPLDLVSSLHAIIGLYLVSVLCIYSSMRNAFRLRAKDTKFDPILVSRYEPLPLK